MYQDRKASYLRLEEARGSRVVVYFTGDRQGLETQMHQEVLELLVDHLDSIGSVDKITLYLYTRGGQTLAAWSIANLIRQFCGTFEVIVPSRALSAGTLLCLAADILVMTKQATLGPIDPSVNSPLNPGVVGAPAEVRLPVSVEEVNGFIELARNVGIADGNNLTTVLCTLASHVHPLVLGNAYRSRSQIRMLGSRLLSMHMDDQQAIDAILDFLCSESGSHDYTIYRPEARQRLGLSVESPDDSLYALIKAIYDDTAKELELTEPFNPGIFLGTKSIQPYCFVRGLVESVGGGSHQFVSEGRVSKVTISQTGAPSQEQIRDIRTFEGWRKQS